jgi:glycosyltransferase involved in cell wall biosynthesis
MGTGRPGIEALKIMGAPEDKLLVFPYFIDIDAYSCENRRVRSESNHAIRFISSGRLVNSAKGHDIALRALARAAHATGKEFEYYIAGTGKDEGELRRLANQLGISGKVKFLGWLEPDKLIQQLVYADVLIHPSPMHEPYGVAVIEGMASGLPVLASDVTCAASERIEHGVNGFIHPRGNVEVLAMQIGFLLRNPDMITEMGQLARKTAEQWPIEQGVRTVKGLLHN